jgi:outer membrane protein assembly factor BamB
VHLTRAGLIGLAALLAGVALAPLLAPALNIRSQSLLAADEDPPTKPGPAQLPPVKGLSAPDYTNVTGYVANAALPTKQPAIVWKFSSDVTLSDVVTADGFVYFGNHDGQLIALKTADGSVVWKYDLPGRKAAAPKRESFLVEELVAPLGAPAVREDLPVGKPAVDKDYVYFGSRAGVTAIRRDDGKFVWHRPIEHGVLEATPLPVGHRVYVSGYDGRAYSLHRPTGHVVWEHDLVQDAPPDPPRFPGQSARFQNIPARPAGAACDGKLFIQCVFDQSRIVAIDCVTGEKSWSYQMGGWTAAAPTIADGRVYIASQDRSLSCVSLASGKVLWKFHTPTWLASRVAVHGGKVYLTCHRGELFQLDAENGKTIRHFISNEDRKSYSCSPIVDDHTVYFATSNGHFVALNVDRLLTTWEVRPIRDAESFTDPATDGRRIFVTTRPNIAGAGGNAIIAFGDASLAVKQPPAHPGRQPALMSPPRANVDDVASHIVAINAETRPLAPESRHPAQEPPPVHRASGFCVDAKGQPVRGAEVHFFQFAGGDDGRYVHFGPVVSDEKGHASSPETLIKNDAGNYDLWIYARVPGRLIGVGRSAQWRHDPPQNPQGRVVLYPSRSVEGKVAVPAGFDPTRVLVRVRTMQIFHGSGDFDFQAFPREDNFTGLDTALPDIFECHPDARGQFHFSDVPIHGRLYLAATGDGLGEGQWWNPNKTFVEPIAIAMQPEAVSSGRVLSPDGTPAIGMKIIARISSQALFDKPPTGYLSAFHAVTDNDGKFVLHGLPGTGFVLSVVDPKKLWAFRPLEDLSVRSGHETILTLRMETGVLVSGRVLDNAGQPVPGAAFSALTDRDNGSSLWEDSTDASGRYQFRLPVGGVKLYFNALPQEFAYPDPQIVKHLEIKTGQAEIHDLNFTLKRKSSQSH